MLRSAALCVIGIGRPAAALLFAGGHTAATPAARRGTRTPRDGRRMQIASVNLGVAGVVKGMSDSSSPVMFLSGAGGGAPDLDMFRDGVDDTTRFEVIGYPGWRRYVADGFTSEALIAELASLIVAKVPRGPIRIVGLSIGGHFGYAIALHLEAVGREIAGFCAIDSFMFVSSKPSAGWKGRALGEALELLRKRRIGDFVRFLRARFWRALVRLAGSPIVRSVPSSILFEPPFLGFRF